MRLSENEIRDINRYLADGKPLPEKYRFLLFEDKREVELVWNGKTNEVTNVVLPFQTIEIVDEPREEKIAKLQTGLFDQGGRQQSGWTNKLIWGDNKLILSSLRNGPLREEIEANGGIKLIYIDPPFDVGADFSMDVQIGEAALTKTPSVIEELAYRDSWGKGADSFIAMMYERLSLMRDLLAEDGAILVNCDWHTTQYIRILLDDIFGRGGESGQGNDKRYNAGHRNEVIWHHDFGGRSKNFFARKHDTIFYYTKSGNWTFHHDKLPYLEYRGNIGANENGKKPTDVWDIAYENKMSKWNLGYPTQKPMELIKRFVEVCSDEGDIVADFFIGSGTSLHVAETLGRKWIGSDIGKFSINIARKRMIAVQRQLKNDNKPYRAFEILNLGKYERQFYIGQQVDQRLENARQIEEQRELAFVQLITRAYQAESIEGFRTFSARKNARLVAIGPVNVPVSRLFVDEVIKEAREKMVTKVDILAFDFELGMGDNARDDAKDYGIDLALKYIPQDVFDKRAIERNQVKFYDVSYIEVKPIIKGQGKTKTLAIELTDFSVHYNQDPNFTLKPGQTKTVVRDGQVLKISKDKDSEIESQEVLTKHWSDWVDYWSIDFDYESKKEIIRQPKSSPEQVELTGETTDNKLALQEYEEVWTGNHIFENEWQSFRTKKDRSLELTSVVKEMIPGNRYKVAIKVVDIFGNDTMKVIEVQL